LFSERSLKKKREKLTQANHQPSYLHVKVLSHRIRRRAARHGTRRPMRFRTVLCGTAAPYGTGCGVKEPLLFFHYLVVLLSLLPFTVNKDEYIKSTSVAASFR